jgi:HAD superfamily hydrolase (TIGR01509 family)
MPAALKAVFFDHDGTLVDSERAHFEICRDVLTPHGVALPEEQYRRFYAGLPTLANAADLVARHALPVAPAALAEEKRAATRAYLARQAFPLMPGAREALSHFSAKGVGVAIVTGSNQSEVGATLRWHALHEAVSAVVCGDDVRQNKPAPECYQLVLQRVAAAPDECVAIEDSEHGIFSATAAGLACVAVPNPMSRHQDFSRASAVVANLADAVRWLDARFSVAAARPAPSS